MWGKVKENESSVHERGLMAVEEGGAGGGREKGQEGARMFPLKKYVKINIWLASNRR